VASPTLNDLPDPPQRNTGWPWTEGTESLSEIGTDDEPRTTISVVTPSYNQGEFIEETIRSVLLQGYPALEYFVVDGGSTDETVSILEKYDSWIDDWVSEPDRGQSHAINKGLRRTSGDVLTWLNSDDYLAPEALRNMAEAFRHATSSVGAIVGIGHKVNRQGEIVYTPDTPELSHEAFLDWMGRGNFMQPACFFRREAWETCGPLREDLQYPMDVDLWLKMAREYEFGRVSETIAYAYEHEQSKTTGERPYMRAETIQLIAEHGGEEIAWRELRNMADDLAEAQRKIGMIKENPLYRYVVGPVYRWLTRTTDPDS